MTTAPDTDQDSTLYGPDGRPLTRPATQPTAATPRPGAPSGDWQPVTTRGNATVWEKTAPAPTGTDASRTAAVDTVPRADLDASHARITELERRLAVEAAKDRRSPAPGSAPVADPAGTEKPKKKPWFDRQGPKIALMAAVGMTASGEFSLAQQAHFPTLVAALLPVAMDVYVIQAMRRHRDIAAALILAIATNALDRLAAVHMIGVDKTVSHGQPVYAASWWLILVVVAIAPFIVWRVHRITETKTKPETKPVVSRDRETTTPETETAHRETSETEVSQVSVSPRETETTAPRETTPTETETALRETTTKTRSHRSETTETNRPETKPRPARPARETNPTAVTAIGDRETETDLLLGLMRSRGGAEKVSLDDAIAETGRPKSTAAKRLAAARDLYAKTA